MTSISSPVTVTRCTPSVAATPREVRAEEQVGVPAQGAREVARHGSR